MGGLSARLAAGTYHSLVVDGSGALWSWGDEGAVGLDDPEAFRAAPARSSLTGVAAVAAGSNHSMVLKDDGTVWTWGFARKGMGYGTGCTPERMAEPVQVMDDVASVEAGQYVQAQYVVRRDGTAFMLGSDCPQNSDPDDRATWPVILESLGKVKMIAAGWEHALALGEDGTVWGWGWSWGSAQSAALGPDSMDMGTTPLRVPGLSGIVAVAAKGETSYALDDQGAVWSWGANDFGELGDGTTEYRSTPTPIPGLKAVSIAAGILSGAAIDAAGGLWVWGDNRNGGLGVNGGDAIVRPVKMPNLPTVVAVSASYHFLALTADGRVYSWGYDGDGGTRNTTTTTPTLMPL